MTTEASVIKDRPAQLRRRPRPAPDETVDPVDYNPATHTPAAPAAAPAKVDEAPAASGGGEEASQPETTPADAAAATETEEEAQVEAPAQTATVLAAPPAPVQEAAPVAAPAPAAPARQSSRASKAKATPNRKSQRREVTFPLSTRVSQEILDLLYDAQENEGVTLRDAIEQGVRMRWGSNR